MRMIIQLLTIFIIGLSNSMCSNSNNAALQQIEQNNEITCSKDGCEGTYIGPEFTNGSDVAHQFSNKISGKVGDKLKELFHKGEYSKVDFSNIKMSTEGMGSGNVTYIVSIPFISVQEKCDAYTSFDHVGGWNHSPALSSRKAQLSKVLMKGEN